MMSATSIDLNASHDATARASSVQSEALGFFPSCEDFPNAVGGALLQVWATGAALGWGTGGGMMALAFLLSRGSRRLNEWHEPEVPLVAFVNAAVCKRLVDGS